MTIDNAALRQFMMQFFSDEELETLCFDYFPEVSADFGSGMSKSRKVIALIGHCDRRGRLADLHAAVARERQAAWQRQFAAPPVEEPRRGVPATTPSRDPRQIFLSHATADAKFAHKLAADLRAEGWRVWIAPASIRAGEKWVEAIDRGLETSGVFVVALTPDAVTSRWVNTETDAAVEMQHEGLITFIPLDVAECRSKRLWRQYQFVPFRGSYEVGLDALLRRLDDNDLLPDGEGAAPPGRASASPAPPRPHAPAPPDRRVHEKTGIELIRIPAGPFLYGSAGSDEMALDNEKPQRTIDLPAYWIGRTPVTNAQFARFVQVTNHRTTAEAKGQGVAWMASRWEWVKGADWRHPSGPKSSIDGKDNHPVVQVSWDDAKAFCDWAGLALPTEEQWEKAARGTDGRLWPWGDEQPTDQHCNFNAKMGGTTPVGKYSPLGDSPYGCADMAGNVWEWMGSWYTKDSTPALRGGSWSDYIRFTRAAYRYNLYYPDVRNINVGFRVVELLSDPGF